MLGTSQWLDRIIDSRRQPMEGKPSIDEPYGSDPYGQHALATRSTCVWFVNNVHRLVMVTDHWLVLSVWSVWSVQGGWGQAGIGAEGGFGRRRYGSVSSTQWFECHNILKGRRVLKLVYWGLGYSSGGKPIIKTWSTAGDRRGRGGALRRSQSQTDRSPALQLLLYRNGTRFGVGAQQHWHRGSTGTDATERW